MHRRTPRRRAWAFGLAWAATVSSPAAISITLDQIATGFSMPVYVTNTGVAGDTRLFVVEQRGRIRIINSGTVLGTDFLDLSPSGLNLISTPLSPGNERGLLGLAFPPDFATSLRFYVSYTDRVTGASVLSRYTVPSVGSNTANTSGTPILTQSQPQSNHNGGWIGFGPDGYLYMAIGDGGASNDTGTGHTAGIGNAQDTTNLLGDMLRLDVSGSSYTNPPGNPFIGVAGADEIYHYGLRNPWRNSFDFTTGMFFIADVGQGLWEEVNIVPAATAGLNFGWRNYEGNVPVLGPAIGGTTFPVHVYAHTSNPNGNLSITGGYVYRGAAYPNLQGYYFFADYNSGRIWTLAPTGPSTWSSSAVEALDNTFLVSSFGEDVNRELYVVHYADSGNGRVLRIRDTTVPATLTVFTAAQYH